MKKTILLLLMAACTMAVTAQKKDAKKEGLQIAKTDSVKNKVPSDTLTVDLSKVRFLKIGDQLHDLKTEIAVFTTFQWCIDAFGFMNNAKSGLSKAEIEQLQSPLFPYWISFQKQLAAQQQEQKEK